MVAKLAACRSAIEKGAHEVFVADGNDLSGIVVLARHGRAGGAATHTRIRNGRPAKRRQLTKVIR